LALRGARDRGNVSSGGAQVASRPRLPPILDALRSTQIGAESPTPHEVRGSAPIIAIDADLRHNTCVNDFLYIIVKLTFGAVTAILAIVLWSRTREGFAIFIILGIISLYLETIHAILLRAGILSDIFIYDVSVLPVVFAALPSIFFIVAFIMMITKSMRV
jgi:hypothetical protein